MSAIQIFQFDDDDENTSTDIRTLAGQDGTQWFVLKDVLGAMKSATKPADAASSIREGLGGEVVGDYPIPDALGRVQDTSIVAESAVTYLVSRGNTETSKKLNRFIHLEVLPALRKTGSFSLAVPNFDDPVAAARAWADAKERELLAERKALALAEQIETERPLTELAKALIGQETMIRRDWISMMKADSGLGSKLKEKEVNKWLVDAGYCYREGINNEMRAYSHSSHLFKLEPETLNGGVRLLLKLTGEGVRQLTPLVLAHFTGQQKK